jgi:hypothetical protein
MSNKPDNVSDNPGLLPYGSNVRTLERTKSSKC